MDKTIGVAIICDDRLNELKRLLLQLSKFDQVAVCHNGSDPKIKKHVVGLGKPFEYHHFDWRPSAIKGPDLHGNHSLDMDLYDINEWGFCYARNFSFGKLNTTHALWLDADDLIGFVRNGKDITVTADQAYKAFKKIVIEAPEEINVWFNTYIYSRDRYNNPNVVHARERLLKDPHKWKWVYPIHEVLVPDEAPKWAMIEDVQIIHYPPTKIESSAERNLRMLHEWMEQLESYGDKYRHDLSRCRLYIGESYWALQEWKTAAKWLMEFIIKHPEALDIEKWQAWCFIAKCQIEINNFEAARAAALAAIDIEPGLCDGYILLAQVKLVTEQDPQDILLLLENAGRAQEPPPQVITNPLDYSYTIYCITSKAKFLLGQYDAALDWATRAVRVAPGDDRAEELRVEAANKVRERDSVESAKALYQLYSDYGENEKAAKLYETLPASAQNNEEVVEAATLAARRVRHLSDNKEYKSFYQNNPHWEPVQDYAIDFSDTIKNARAEYVLDRLKSELPNGGRVLDVGCSDGFYSMMMAKAGYEVVGVDIDQRCVDLANKRASERNLTAKFVQGFFEEMSPDKTYDPFEEPPKEIEVRRFETYRAAIPWFHHFDAVVCTEVIEYAQNPQFLMGCLADCAKDNAPVIITTLSRLSRERLVSDDIVARVRVFNQDSFESLLKSDPELDVVEAHSLDDWYVGEVRRREHADGPIIRISCGDMFLPFTPSSVDTGIGGSELAVVEMAKEWAKLGCQVVVYNSAENGIYDGVFYRNYKHFSLEHRSDIFINWRHPQIGEKERANAKTTVLWTHDLYYPGDEYPWLLDDRFDKIVLLSQFHKDYFLKVHPGVPEDKIWVSRNGINPARYTKKIDKVPHRYFYSSSFDRGLEELLQVWPEIVKEIPDAELHVCYGIEIAEKVYKSTGETDKLNQLYRILRAVRSTDRVVYHDQIGQQELADLQMSCEAWLYPPQPNHPNGMGGFLETYCITALEAQAARCVPISRNNGALKETLHLNFINWGASETIHHVLGKLQVSNERPAHIQRMLDENQEWSLSRSWQSLAKEWLIELSPKESEDGSTNP